MSDDVQSGDRGGAEDRPQDPLVERLRPDPAQPAEPARILEGVLGDSDRPGFRRLYFTAELDYYAEFRSEDVLSVADIQPDQPPFLGEPATRVTLRRDATIDFTHSVRTRPLDEFDLDVRLASSGAAQLAAPGFGDTEFFGCTQFCTADAQCPGGGTGLGCGGGTFGCPTGQITVCKGATCNCETRRPRFCNVPTDRTCGEATCQTCGQATCQTCGQATCQTCGQATCQTCGQATCAPTCRTCETRCGTCETQCGTCAGGCGTQNPRICRD